MKKSACSELHGKIIHARTILPARNIALYEVDFENGRTAVLRVSTTFPLREGDTIERINDVSVGSACHYACAIRVRGKA